MKFITLGMQCSVPEAIKQTNLREYSYPFDWLWVPSQTTYKILNILINNGTEKALNYMTTGYTYYRNIGYTHFISVDHITENQMNKNTGLGITHFKINNKYKTKLRRRLKRLLDDIKSNENLLFIYADAANPYINYYLDEIEYGVDATKYLLQIYKLIYPLNNNIKIVYFCWNKRKRKNGIIEYISYYFKDEWGDICELIKTYLIKVKNNILKDDFTKGSEEFTNIINSVNSSKDSKKIIFSMIEKLEKDIISLNSINSNINKEKSIIHSLSVKEIEKLKDVIKKIYFLLLSFNKTLYLSSNDRIKSLKKIKETIESNNSFLLLTTLIVKENKKLSKIINNSLKNINNNKLNYYENTSENSRKYNKINNNLTKK